MSFLVPVLTHDHATRRQVARALFSGGMDVRFLERVQDLPAVAREANVSLLLIDADTVELPDVERVLDQLRGPYTARIPVVLLSVGADKDRLSELLARYEIGNLVAKHGAIRAAYPVLDERELLVTCQKVVRRDIFGLEKYIGAWGTAVHRARLTGMQDKYRVLAEFEGFLTDLECPSLVVPDILTVADEFMLNAVMHAPRDESGKPRYEHLEPDPNLLLRPNEYVDIAYACDGQRLMFSTVDNFGTLKRETLKTYVSKGFRSEKRRIEMKASGAGLGLSMAFLNIHQLIFNIHENHRTEAIAGWYLRVSNAAEFRQVSKSLNCFWVSESDRVNDSPPAEPLSGPPPAVETAGVTVKHLRGRITETARLLLSTELRRLDLREVTGFSSHGVLLWTKFIASLEGRPLELLAVPEVMVRLSARVEGMFTGVTVQTVMAPYRCQRCGNNAVLELPPAQVLMSEAGICQPCGGELLFHGDRADYEQLLETLAVE